MAGAWLRLLPVVAIAFTQGAMDFYGWSLFYYYKEGLQVSASALSLIQSLVSLPWSIKPFLGMVSDNQPLFGSRRKSYLLAASAVEMLMLLALALMPGQVAAVVALQFMASLSLVSRNVIGEALIVESSKEEMRANPQRSAEEHEHQSQRTVSFFFGAKSVGSLIFSFLGGYALKFITPAQVFLISASFSLILFALLAVIYHEAPAADAPRPQEVSVENSLLTAPTRTSRRFAALQSLKVIYKALSTGRVRNLIAVVCLLIANPGTGSIMNFYYTDVLGFSPSHFGTLSLCGGVAYLSGIISFNLFFKRMPFRPFFIATSAIAGFFNINTLLLLFGVNRRFGISDFAYVLCTSSFWGLVTEINFLPVLAVGCRICPPGLEATTYAVFTAVFNTAGYVSNMIGSLIIYALRIEERRYSNLWVMVVGQLVYSTLATAVLFWVRFDVVADTPAKTEEIVGAGVATPTRASLSQEARKRNRASEL